MVRQWGLKVLLYRKALTRQRTSQNRGKGCRTSMRAQHRGRKRDFKKGPRKGNCFVRGIPVHFAKDCRRKETAQWSKCGEKGHLDRACKRQRDGGKHESVAVGPTLASPDEEYWAALTHWKTAGLLMDSGCTDHIMTNIDAFLDFVLIQSMVRNPNGEASRVVGRGCVRISIPSNKGEIQCELKNVLGVPNYSSNLLSVAKCTECGHSFTFEKGNSCMKIQKGTRVKLSQEHNLFYLPCSVLEFKMSSNDVKLDYARKWHRRLGHLNQADVVRNALETVGELDDVCNVCALAKTTNYPVTMVAETQAEEKLEKVFTVVMGLFRVESLSGFRFCNVFADQYKKFVFVDLLKAKSEHWPAWRSLFSVRRRPRGWDKTMRRSFSQSSSRYTVYMQAFYRRRPYRRRHNRMG